MKLIHISLPVFFAVVLGAAPAQRTSVNPRIGIVISKASYRQKWGVVQMSAQGWAGVANLAGIPYDCLFLDEMPDDGGLARYGVLVFTQCGYAENGQAAGLAAALKKYIDRGGSLVIDGPLALYDETGKDRDHAELDRLLGIAYDGFRGGPGNRIKVRENLHYITAPFEAGQYVTQHLAGGLNVVGFASGGRALLVTADEKEAYPFLSAREEGRNRTVLVSDFATWSGAASFFRNEQPQVFYANRLYELLIRALHWAVYGEPNTPFPVPQVSNASLTAIIRLDADASGNLDAQVRTVNYLVDIARESGVVPLYAWVSGAAARAGWPDLAPLGKKIEDVGGEIGTHSRYHRIDGEMTEPRWKEELDGSIRDIEFNMDDTDHPVGKVDLFINPGNTIHMEDYGQLARRFALCMTHGFEQDTPIGYGNCTWYTGAEKDFVVLDDTPSPDYQWFYDPTWSYTTAQITAYEEAVFDHLFRNIGRGVIFDQMWHDYSITTQPQSGKTRFVNPSNIAMYDGLKARFAAGEIYCPTPVELTHKLRAMAQWDYRWSADDEKMAVVLDLSPVRTDTVPFFTGGMGLRIENTGRCIQAVMINGREHWAFSDRTVILPNLVKGRNTLEITLGPDPFRGPHLTYVSKRMPDIRKTAAGLEFTILTKCRARFDVYMEESFVLVNADRQEWNRKGDNLLRGTVDSDRKPVLRKIKNRAFSLCLCTVPVTDFRESGSNITMALGRGKEAGQTVVFRSPNPPRKVSLNSGNLDVVRKGDRCWIALPDFGDQAELRIEL